MSLVLEDVEQLLAGHRGPIHVGELPYEVWTKLGLIQANVYLGRDELVHVLQHRGIDRFDVLRIPFCIRHGLLILEKAKPCIIATYQDPESYRRFIVAMKVANKKSEVWVSSFYRGKARQTRRLLKRGTILKTHS